MGRYVAAPGWQCSVYYLQQCCTRAPNSEITKQKNVLNDKLFIITFLMKIMIFDHSLTFFLEWTNKHLPASAGQTFYSQQQTVAT